MQGNAYLEALLGAVSNDGASIPIASGLNFTDGVQVVPNAITKRNDVSLINPPQPIVSQADWNPDSSNPSDDLEVMAAEHPAGFYLVAISVSFTDGTIGSGGVSPVFTWHSDAADRDITLTEIPGSSGGYAQGSQVVYSDGSAAITAGFVSTIDGEGLNAIVRANAVRLSA
jgi:hypothetical protein